MTEQIRCHKCGKTFGLSSELRKHERNCKGGSLQFDGSRRYAGGCFYSRLFFYKDASI
jgi:hypothetical protein